MRLKTYSTIWLMIAKNTLQEAFINRWTNLLFFLGKIARFAMSLVFIFLIRSQVSQVGDYSTDELVIFFLTYVVVDTSAQVLFRGVYLFSHWVRNGDFDFYLAKPINPLFRALTGKPDFNDALFLPVTIIIGIYIVSQLGLIFSSWQILGYLALILNGLLLATALHILVLSMGILTTEVDGVIWLYRDLAKLGQIPVTFYLEIVRLALTFLFPIGIMITVPAQYLIGVKLSVGLPIVITFSISFFWLSLRTWNWCLKRYSSASS